MNENDNSFTNEAVEKIMENIENLEGQFVPLTYATGPLENMNNWQQPSYFDGYNLYNCSPPGPYLEPLGNISKPKHYGLNQEYINGKRHPKNVNTLNGLEYGLPETMCNGSSSVFENNFGAVHVLPEDCQNSVYNLPDAEPNHSAHLIENLAGNWVPTSTGTYSPFGNISPFFSKESEHSGTNIIDNATIILGQKPSETKPQRPSYSDVLAKTVTQNSSKSVKVDAKDAVKLKREARKSTKSDKPQKINHSMLNSGLPNTDKETPGDKTNHIFKPNDKSGKDEKNTQFNRKWVSLDDLKEHLDVDEADQIKEKKANVTQKILLRTSSQKSNKNSESPEKDSECSAADTANVARNGLKKFKSASRQKSSDVLNNSRSAGRKTHRLKRKESSFYSLIGQKLKPYLQRWWDMTTVFVLWIVHLVYDICSLSVHISHDVLVNFWNWLYTNCSTSLVYTFTVFKTAKIFVWIVEKFKFKKKPKETVKSENKKELQNNITMPTTGEEAMKRLLACKGKDPYSILGVTPTCADDDIKRYYKKQAFLVHPDKNQQPGAEEAFKILVHAFDMIGEPERRAAHDKGVMETVQVEQAWSELSELLAQLQQKMEAAANTIRCSICANRHKRVKTERPSYAARNCSTCKIHHSAKEGDIWAESKYFGFKWHYYACMEGGVYNITEWAVCQKTSLKHLRPDSHQVQYRIALGKQNNQSRKHSGTSRSDQPADFENLLNTLYGQNDSMQGNKRRTRKPNK